MTTESARRRPQIATDAEPASQAETRPRPDTSQTALLLAREVMKAADETIAGSPEQATKRLAGPETTRLAITDCATGASMRQASLNRGFNPSWLNHWRQRHPEDFDRIYAEITGGRKPPEPRPGRQTDPEAIRLAITDYAQGAPMSQASRNRGFGPDWLTNWRRQHPEEFDRIYAGITGGRKPPEPKLNGETTGLETIRLAIADYADGASMSRASLNRGFGSSWLNHWRRQHPEEFDRIYAETTDGQKPPELKRSAPAGPGTIRLAIADYAAGASMSRASLNRGFSPGWLGQRQRQHPEEFDRIYAEVTGGSSPPKPKLGIQTDFESFELAVADYADGASMSRASLNRGFGVSWLATWRRNCPEEFDRIYAQITGGRKPPEPEWSAPADFGAIRLAIADYAQGTPMSRAGLELGFGKGWLSVWRRQHPEEFDRIYAEITGGRKPPEPRSGRQTDPEAIRLAIAGYAAGASMSQASLDRGFGPDWLANWRRRHPEAFDRIYAEVGPGSD